MYNLRGYEYILIALYCSIENNQPKAILTSHDGAWDALSLVLVDWSAFQLVVEGYAQANEV